MPKNSWFGQSLVAGLASVLLTSGAAADMPKDRPFAMRGVELGIDLDQFRQAPIPNDGNRYSDLQVRCSNDSPANGITVSVSAEDRADGIVECKWFSRDGLLHSSILWEHWIDIGTGKGIPTFSFIETGGRMRLFRVSFYANNEYYPGILDALTRGYGSPSSVIEPFKTLSGSDFTSMTSVWDNGLSSITLVQRCGHLERYCLTYNHTAYSGLYAVLKEKRAAAAAGKI